MVRRIWAGLDVGVETTTICVVDDAGQVLRRSTTRTSLSDVHRELRWLRRRKFARVGLEAGIGVHLARGLRSIGYSVDLYEARKLSKFLSVRRNKTDAGDAKGIAEAGRIGATLVSRVHVKSVEMQSLHSRLTIRRHLIAQRLRAENLLCRQLELFGGRISGFKSGKGVGKKANPQIKKLFGKADPLQAELRYLIGEIERLFEHQELVDRDLARLARGDEICRRFMQIPGVGPICALTYYAAISEPHRFKRSANVGAYFGLAPRIHQSGLLARSGRISKMGHAPTRSLLVQAGIGFMRWSDQNSPLREWTMRIEQRRGRGSARIALARKLGIIMLAMWKSGEDFRDGRTSPAANEVVAPDSESLLARSGAPGMVEPASPEPSRYCRPLVPEALTS